MSLTVTEIETVGSGAYPPRQLLDLRRELRDLASIADKLDFGLTTHRIGWCQPTQVRRSGEENRRETLCRAGVSQQTTSICIVNEEGAIVAERNPATSPDAIMTALEPFTLTRAGLETGPLSI